MHTGPLFKTGNDGLLTYPPGALGPYGMRQSIESGETNNGILVFPWILWNTAVFCRCCPGCFRHRCTSKGHKVKKHGGMYFWKLGPFGGSFYVRATARPRLALAADVAFACAFGLALGTLAALGI